MSKFILSDQKRAELLIQISKSDCSLKNCAKSLKVNTSTIYRELVNKSCYRVNMQVCNKCCDRTHCIHCTSFEIENVKKVDFIEIGQCEKTKEPLCRKLKKFPYVCNNCSEKQGCKLLKRYYDPRKANEMTETLKSKSRIGIMLSKEQIKDMDVLVSPLIRNGLSTFHIYTGNKSIQDLISFSTFRRYVYNHLFTSGPAFLPCFVRYDRVRPATIFKKRAAEYHRDDGYGFNDFISYIKQQPNQKDYWEYDSVIGKTSDKLAIMTITYVEFDFQFGLLYRHYDYEDAFNKLRELQAKFGEDFWKIFKVNLSDNGDEFRKFKEIQTDPKTGEVKCKTFFTRPHMPSDKGDCENNHKYVRYILLKGQTFDNLTQEKVNLVFSHVNGLIRDSKNKKAPYQLMVERFGKDFCDKLGIRAIKPNDVVLKPFLLTNNNCK